MEKVLPLLFFERKVKAHSRSFFFLFSGGVSEQVISKKKKGGSPPPCCQLVGRPCPHPSSTRRPGSVSVAMTAMSGCERAVKRSLELARWRDQSSFRQKKKKNDAVSRSLAQPLSILFSLFFPFLYQSTRSPSLPPRPETEEEEASCPRASRTRPLSSSLWRCWLSPCCCCPRCGGRATAAAAATALDRGHGDGEGGRVLLPPPLCASPLCARPCSSPSAASP